MDELTTHWLGRFVMTVGVQAEIEANKGHWLADAVASYQGDPRVKGEEFQVWTLKVNADKSATLSVGDGNDGPPLAVQGIEFTDFPAPGTAWWLVGSGGSIPVLMLPEEY